MHMAKLKITTDARVAEKYRSYPPHVRAKIKALRKLVLDTAKTIESIETVEETLKWGEPSFVVDNGSTLRVDWKSKTPEQYAMYFKCTSKLVDTFQEVFGDTFNYEGSRAIVFQLGEKVPEDELKQCIKATLTYHDVKHLAKLGIET